MTTRARSASLPTLALVALLAASHGCSATRTCRWTDPRPAGNTLVDGTLVLTPIARLGPGARKEISGIVRSQRDPAAFWTLNDSGDEPRIYPIRADGSLIPSVRYPDIPGTLVGNAINGDWEDIALDASGRIIIADFGNNSNARADLALYILPEPELTEGRTAALARIPFRYPDQPSLPAPADNFNFDAEALFTIGDDIYILTKHRSDTATKLYRLDARNPHEVNALTLIERHDIGAQVTAADASPDGLRLAVLGYDTIWLFERASLDQSFFAAPPRKAAYRMNNGRSDSEAICFESDATLLIADEARGTLHRVQIGELR